MSVSLPVHTEEHSYALAYVDRRSDDVPIPANPPRPVPQTAAYVDLRKDLGTSANPTPVFIRNLQQAAYVKKRSDNIPPPTPPPESSLTAAYVGRRSESFNPALPPSPGPKFHPQAPTSIAPSQCSRCGLCFDGIGMVAPTCPRCNGQGQMPSGAFGAGSMPGYHGGGLAWYPMNSHSYPAPQSFGGQWPISQYPPQQYCPYSDHYSGGPQPQPYAPYPPRPATMQASSEGCCCTIM